MYPFLTFELNFVIRKRDCLAAADGYPNMGGFRILGGMGETTVL